MSLSLCPRWRNKMNLFIYLLKKQNISYGGSCNQPSTEGGGTPRDNGEGVVISPPEKEEAHQETKHFVWREL